MTFTKIAIRAIFTAKRELTIQNNLVNHTAHTRVLQLAVLLLPNESSTSMAHSQPAMSLYKVYLAHIRSVDIKIIKNVFLPPDLLY